jgi:hypothetical protein
MDGKTKCHVYFADIFILKKSHTNVQYVERGFVSHGR